MQIEGVLAHPVVGQCPEFPENASPTVVHQHLCACHRLRSQTACSEVTRQQGQHVLPAALTHAAGCTLTSHAEC